jgi:hypothetical protein
LQSVPVKIGAWGGSGGSAFQVNLPPKRVQSITLRAGDAIDSIGFSYVDVEDQEYTLVPVGGTGGQLTTVRKYYDIYNMK